MFTAGEGEGKGAGEGLKKQGNLLVMQGKGRFFCLFLVYRNTFIEERNRVVGGQKKKGKKDKENDKKRENEEKEENEDENEKHGVYCIGGSSCSLVGWLGFM